MAVTLCGLALAVLQAPCARAEPSEAGATPSATATSEAEQHAQQLLREGVELRRSGDELTALSRFEQADAIWPSPRAKAQIGLAEKSLKRYAPAEKHLSEALSATDDPWIDSNRGVLDSALAFVAARAPAEPKVQQASPAASTPSAPPTPLATLSVPRPAEAPAAPAQKPAATDPRRVAVYATAALALVSAGVGGYFAVRTIELRNDRDEVCPEARCPTQHGVDLDQDARRAATLATVSTVVAASSTVAATYLWLTRENSAERPQAQGASRFSIAAGGLPGGAFVQASWAR